MDIVGAQRELLRRGNLELVFKYLFGIAPSCLQTAITRAADGKPIGDSLTEEECYKYFGCKRESLGPVRPTLVVLVCGIRGGKSLLAAVASITRAMDADMSHLKKHMVAGVKIVCPKTRNAEETFRHILGAIEDSPGLKSCMLGEPKWSPHPELTLVRHDGRKVRVEVMAADSEGLSMRSGYLAGYVLDEAAMFGEASSGAVVNAEGILNAAQTRILPGGQGWVVSSPYGRQGLLYDLYNAHWGKPGKTLVVHAPTLAMNPKFDAKLVEEIRAKNPDVAAREYDAEWVDADSNFFEGRLIEASTRAEPLERPPAEGSRYIATMDAATRGNAWTLTVSRDTRAASERIARIEITLGREWVGSRVAPLDPSVVLAAIKEIVEPYGIRAINCDAWAIDPLRSIAKTVGIELIEHSFVGEQRTEVYRAVDALLRQTDRLELPPYDALTRDLRNVRKRASANGVTPHLPLTSDGRHCDFGPSVSLAVWLLAGSDFGRDMAAAMDRLKEEGIGSIFEK